MTVYIAPISSGLGDLIVSLPAIQGLIASGEPTYLVTRSARQEGLFSRIGGLAGEVAEKNFDASRLPAGDRYINLRDHPLQRNWVWGSSEFEKAFGPITMIDIVSILAKDFGISAADFQVLTPLKFQHLPELSQTIALVPGTDGFQKHWPRTHWLDLVERLSSVALKCVLLGQPECSPAVAELIAAGLPWLPTATIGHAVDAISSALACVSVDTGLMHISVHQGRPTVSLFNRRGLYRRMEGNCRPILADECQKACQESFPLDPNMRKTDFSWHDNQIDRRPCAAPIELSCMASIKPVAVLEALADLGVLDAKSPAVTSPLRQDARCHAGKNTTSSSPTRR